jgi:hypothetical protein
MQHRRDGVSRCLHVSARNFAWVRNLDANRKSDRENRVKFIFPGWDPRKRGLPRWEHAELQPGNSISLVYCFFGTLCTYINLRASTVPDRSFVLLGHWY